MPTITLNKDVLEKLIGKRLPLDKLKDRISMLGTDLESIEGNKIHVEIFPNRPDLLSEQGFARAFSSFIGVKTGLQMYKVKKSRYKLFVKNTPPYWPYAIAFIARGLRLDQEKVRELIQLQEKIGITMLRNRKKGGIGLYPLQKLQFPITFEGRKPEQIMFRPLESPGVLPAREILREHKKGKEYGHLMETWDTFTVFVDNNGTIMSMPPIINSHEMGKIDETTEDLFIECTGKDLNVITKAINIFAASLSDMGAAIESVEVHYGGKKWDVPDLHPSKMKLDLGYVNRRLGLALKEKEVNALLERMGYGYDKGTVLIPAYRADILHQIDLVEDIAIAYGYEHFEEIIPSVATIGEESKQEVFKSRIAKLLVGLGLLETSTYHLIDKDIQTSWMKQSVNPISIVDPVSLEYNSLRTGIIPSLLFILRENKHHEYPQQLFEIGTIFTRQAGNAEDETGIAETPVLCIVSCHQNADFTEIRQMLDYVLHHLNVHYEVKEGDHSSFIPGRFARVVVQGKDVVEIAHLGEIHPEVLHHFGLEMPTCCLEVNLKELFEIVERQQ